MVVVLCAFVQGQSSNAIGKEKARTERAILTQPKRAGYRAQQRAARVVGDNPPRPGRLKDIFYGAS